MYEEMLLDKYRTYSCEELQEITVAKGYTEEAEQIARQILSEKEAEDSDSDMTTEQLNEMLYDEYKTYSYEELQEITFANGYTKEAEQIARQLLGEDTTEYREDINTQEMWGTRREALPVQNSAMKVHCKAIAWIGSVLGILYTCILLVQISPMFKSGILGFALLLLTLAIGSFVIYVIWVLWHTFAEILEKLDIMGSSLKQMDQQIKKK